MANGQYTFTDMEYAARKRATRKDEFLRQMDKMIPWTEWVEMIRPYYPKGERGRAVRGIETMTRMYLLQMWFNLSDEGVEDAIYDSYAMRSFISTFFATGATANTRSAPRPRPKMCSYTAMGSVPPSRNIPS